MAPPRAGSDLDRGRQLYDSRLSQKAPPPELAQLPRRQQEHLRKIWVRFGVKLKGRLDLSRAPSSSKLKELARFKKDSDVIALWDRADEITTADLARRRGADPYVNRTINNLTPEEAEDLDLAMEIAQREGKTRQGAAFHRIVTFYLTSRHPKKPRT